MHRITDLHLRSLVIHSLGGGFKFGLSNTMTFQHRITIDDTQKNVMSSGMTLVRTLLREEYNVQLLTVWEGS
jgi:hypothetical protein